MGSTSVASVGGANSLTLAAGNIPQVSTSYTPAGTTNIGHSHSLGTTNVSLASGSAASVDINHQHNVALGQYAIAGGSSATALVSNTTGSIPTSGAMLSNNTHSHSVSGTTNIDHSHTLGTTNIALTGTAATITVGNASPTALENRPLYFSVVYLMRVK
jgi:hypothetical protein